MLNRTVIVALFSAILALTGIRASAQAYITENETSYIYVDASWGNDANAGSWNSPLKTIQAAVDRANANNRSWVGTKVIIYPGTYRETVTVGAWQSTTAPTTIEALVAGTVNISGSDQLWNWTKDNSTIWSHSWTAYLGNCAVPSGWPWSIAPIARRAEQLFINGVAMTQVMSYGDLKAGTFYVSDGGSSMYVYPPYGTNMYSATIEASTRRETLAVSNRSNLVFRGLTFEHAANCMNQSSAVVSNSNNILFDSDQALWNSWGGIGIFGSSNVTIQGTIGNYNGGVGITGSQDVNVLLNWNQTDYNNWRGAQTALYNWGMGGTKLMQMRNTTVENHFSYRNQAQGLWFDTDNQNVTINNATLSQNVLASLQLEANQGPITLENSHLCSSGTGALLINSKNVTVKDNAFYNNGGTGSQQAELYLGGNPGGRWVRDWQTGVSSLVYTSGMTLNNNAFVDAAYGQNIFGTYLSGNDWSEFAYSLNAWSNSYYDPSTQSDFKITGNKLVTLPGWRSATGTDYSSWWGTPSSSPAGPCWVSNPWYSDFAVNLDRQTISMVKGSGSATVYLNSFGYGTVYFSVSGLPSGVWAWPSQNNISSGALTLWFGAATWASNQTVPVTIWAVSGSRVHSITVYVSVTHA